ncbi:MAG: aryl-sulfate sulfotransferase [Candidatus Neomarinimicrobiota bacterium]
MKKYFLTILIFNFVIGALLYPENEATLNQIHVRFEWEQIPGAELYILYVSENGNIYDDCIICNKSIGKESLIHLEKESLEWNKTYQWTILGQNSNQEMIPTDIKTFNTASPISNTTTEIYNENGQEGLTIFGSFFDYYSAVIDENGNEIWNSAEDNLIFYNTDDYGRFFGSEFIGNNAENNYPGIKFSFEDGIEWQEPGDNFIHHDIFQLPNGNYIGLGTSYGEGPIPLGTWTPLFQGLGFEADGETIEFDWMGDKIIEWDANTKEEVWSWNVFDHFDMSDYDKLGGIWFEAYNTNRFDWTHANAIWFDEDDSALYLSSRHLNRITKISYPSGEVIWNLGHEMGSGDIDCGQDIGFSFQHSLQKLSNGNILTFDNGNLSEIFLNQDEKTSRSIEIDITDTSDGCEANLAWEYVLPENLYGYLSGNTQKLENGNYLSTTIGGGGTSIEVDGDGNQIWESNYNLQIPDGLVYRAMRIPGLFPIAYSVVFPQFETSLSEMTIENNNLEVWVKNNGDYKQKFNYNLNVENNSAGYEATFIITPEHHPEVTKSITFNIIISSDSNFMLTDHQDSFTLNPGRQIILSFNDQALNNNQILNGSFNLEAPYPNPFNPKVNFNIDILNSQNIDINIYDIKGKHIENIFNGFLGSGNYNFGWDGKNYSAGIYIIKCKTNKISQTQKIFLIK